LGGRDRVGIIMEGMAEGMEETVAGMEGMVAELEMETVGTAKVKLRQTGMEAISKRSEAQRR
jgi:hypothetical protein